MLLQNQRLSLFIILCCVLQARVLVEGLYQLEATVFGYNNPTGRCRDCLSDVTRIRGCCDDFHKFTNCSESLCDSFFIYCLRTIGSTGRGCSYFGNRTSNPNTDDGPINFSPSRVLGLENPVILQGLTSAYTGVQLHIEIWDDDSHFPESHRGRPNELIDVLLINHDLPIGQPSTRQNYTGIYSFKYVTMDLSITARCVKNFQGSDCSRCSPGFAGTMCNTKPSECDCSGHGQCFDGVPSLTCNCDPGFTGKLCQTNIDDCAGVDCSGNGECFDGANSFICRCNSGFGGPFCTEEIRGGISLISTVGGAVGGAVVLIIFLILIALLIAKSRDRNRREIVNVTLNVETKEIEKHDVSMATVLRQHHDQTRENNTMDRNASYAMTEHAYEIVH